MYTYMCIYIYICTMCVFHVVDLFAALSLLCYLCVCTVFTQSTVDVQNPTQRTAKHIASLLLHVGVKVSFHNFKSQKIKLSVLNPKNKYVACLSVLSQISNCQSLGRKNKHEILKTDRSHLGDLNARRGREPHE